MRIRSVIKFSLIICFLFFFSTAVNALGSASTGFSGNNSVYVGNNIEVILYVGGVTGTTDNGGLAAFGGNISYSSDKLELISSSSLAPFTVELVGSRLGGFGQNTIKGRSNIIRLVFKAKALGSATISYSGSSQPDASASPVSISGCSKTINITNPPSSNNNLKSLTINNGTLSPGFSSSNTSYSVNVGSNVTSISINASAEDSGSSISGTGTKNLGYGSNRFNIVVTAPSGAQKTYSINVIRADDRSSNNNLSVLTVNGGSLNPGFNKNTTYYTLSVPYEISSLNVGAVAEDSKASVSVSGNYGLVAEETQDVRVVVTAENGSSKTYTISVSRGKDPNKILSNNNYLTHLKPSIGILSPVYDKEKTEYEIWLPYEIRNISFEYDVEDKRYAKASFEGPEKLQSGVSNTYKINVVAESEQVRTYTIQVKRAKNPSYNSDNVFLKELVLNGGSLTKSFDKNVMKYNYKKNGKDFKIENAIPEDENSAVNYFYDGDTIYIIVTSSSGEYGVYRLELEENNIFMYILYLILFVIGVIVGVSLQRFVLGKIKFNKLDKLKKDVKKLDEQNNKKRQIKKNVKGKNNDDKNKKS